MFELMNVLLVFLVYLSIILDVIALCWLTLILIINGIKLAKEKNNFLKFKKPIMLFLICTSILIFLLLIHVMGFNPVIEL